MEDRPRIVAVTRRVARGKHYGDSFEATNLEKLLEQCGVGRLYLVGAQTDWCIRSTLHGAVARGYDTFLVGDAHTTGDTEIMTGSTAIEYTNNYWRWHRAPDRECGVVSTAALTFD